ncbi:hypothetical protein [Kutzneria sp. CA-103260]|uniref:hypothetical protein n=1 Tax=Kutzneria sp. CA-103260 TaxID=2802641 RepID=UPI001BA910BD|nr:hypothetical protein [Kutzneria sp. CA-103260]QUQ68699.1 hypothetical protein JJ691_64460 [Kutzneria sp. CA-103260]
MTEDTARDRFLRSLVLARRDTDQIDTRDREFVRAVLDFGSDTDDNTECVERVGPALLPQLHGSGPAGFTLRHSRIPVADVLNAAEGTPVPDHVTAEFPEVTQEDWNAILRLATLAFVAFQTPPDR